MGFGGHLRMEEAKDEIDDFAVDITGRFAQVLEFYELGLCIIQKIQTFKHKVMDQISVHHRVPLPGKIRLSSEFDAGKSRIDLQMSKQ